MTICFEVVGDPRGKGRHRSVPLMRGGKPILGNGGRPVLSQYSDGKTLAYEKLVRAAARAAWGDRLPLTGPLSCSIEAFYPVPASWPRVRRVSALAGAILPTGKPDLDNVVKAIRDGCNGLLWLDDAQICAGSETKHYAERPRVLVRVVALPALRANPLPKGTVP